MLCAAVAASALVAAAAAQSAPVQRLQSPQLVDISRAEGSRGRRWREAVVAGGVLVHSLLYETGVDRRFTHLELATPTGLATLHPEGDGTLHGNVVRAQDGVEHVVGVPFSADGVLLVAGSPLASAAVAWALGGGVAPPSLLELDPVTLSIEPAGDPSAALPAAGAIDPRGGPVLVDARIWPLERDDEG